MPAAVRSCQRRVNRDDSLAIFGRQHRQPLLIVIAHCGKDVLHDLDVVLNARKVPPFLWFGSRGIWWAPNAHGGLLLYKEAVMSHFSPPKGPKLRT